MEPIPIHPGLPLPATYPPQRHQRDPQSDAERRRGAKGESTEDGKNGSEDDRGAGENSKSDSDGIGDLIDIEG